MENLPATQQTLENLNIKIPLEKFTNGDIYKPINIPNTYHQLKAKPQGFFDFVKSPIKGVIEDLVDIVTIITPNGDGKNDFLMFKGLQKFGTNTLKIYNRWGALIYQKVNYHHDDEIFDGTYKNERLPSGNYYYVLSFQSGEIKQKLTVVRD